MIFVTVGTTMPYDELIEAIDIAVGNKQIAEDVICQIGNGEYIPKNCEYFRFLPNVNDYIQQANIVVGHGGTGTVLSLINSEKKFVAVVNPMGAGNHQKEFLDRLSKEVDLVWTEDVHLVFRLIQKLYEKDDSKPSNNWKEEQGLSEEILSILS